MSWYAAHGAFYFRLKSGTQESFSVWENVYLVRASNEEEAKLKAHQIARSQVDPPDETLTLDGEPAELVFVGLRKIISVAHIDSSEELRSGDEITYSEFVLPSMESVKRFAAGESLKVEYLE